MSTSYVLILAGGRGSRMKTKLPKPCLCLGGKSLLQHILDTVHQIRLFKVAIVHNPDSLKHLKECVKSPEDYVWIEQTPSLGTGHAVQCAVRQYFHDKKGYLVVLNADAPFISTHSIKGMLGMIMHPSDKVEAVVLSGKLLEPFGYGRLVETEASILLRIVEEKDATEEEKRIQKVNGGAYAFDMETLNKYIELLDAENAKGEYYLTDLFEIFFSKGHRSAAVPAFHPREMVNINTPEDLTRARQCML